MNKIKNKINKNFLSFFGALFSLELLFRILSQMNIFDWAVLRIALSSSIIALSLSIFLTFFKERTGKIISILILFILTLYALAQAGFLNFLGVYISINSTSQVGAVKEYILDFIHSLKSSYYLLFLPFISYSFYKIFLEKKIFKKIYFKENNPFQKRANKKESILAFSVVILLLFLYNQTLILDFMQNDIQLESNKVLFKNPTNLNISINQFGTTVFAYLDIKTTLIKPKEEIIIFEEPKKEENPETDFTRLIDDTEWQLINEKTTDSNYKILNSYFMNRSITNKNEQTGIFKDKNLIVIMMESVGEIFINPEFYPTFYKLYSEGWSFKNSYSPRNTCATMNNEMSGMISLFSINRNCTANVYQDNTYFESIFNLFNKAGYKTSSFHNYDETYYYRSTIHKNLGSGAFYGASDLNIPINTAVYAEWPSDVSLIEEALERIDTENPFMAWMTTVTAHQPYGVSSTYGDKYLDLFENTSYTMAAKRYMSKLKELDFALEKLLTLLKEKDILEDTVIILYGDHYPYGLDKNSIKGVLGDSVLEKNNIEKTPFVIYNSEIEPKSYEAYTSYMNLVPTVANLFDLEYDPRLYMGEDLFNPLYSTSYKNRVIFTDGSWESEIGGYNATTGKITYFNEKKYENGEIVRYNKEINEMMKMSNLAIQTNYFHYLNEEMNKIKKEKQE